MDHETHKTCAEAERRVLATGLRPMHARPPRERGASGTAMTGPELKAARRRAGLSQTAMGERVGISRHAVSLWETKPWVDVRRPTPRRMLMALAGLDGLPTYNVPNTRAWDGVLLPPDAWDALFEHPMARLLAGEERRRAEQRARRERDEAAARAWARVPCGAHTRKGTACRALSEPGRRRCRFHGGRSTGPRTAEGRARIAEAQRLRWAQWRLGREEDRE